MATYEINGAPAGREADAFQVTKAGFSYAAFVFGPFWLAAFRLWLPLAIYLACAVVAGVLSTGGWLSGGAVLALEFTAGVFIGLEGPRWLSETRERRGYPLVDIVEAANARDAADLYIVRSLGEASSAPPPPRPAPIRPSSRGEPHVLGLFPEARRR